TEGRLPALIASFHRRYPESRLVLREVHTRQVLDLLRRGEVDLGLIHLGRVGTTVVGLQAAGPSLALARLAPGPLRLIGGPAPGVGGRTRVELGALGGEPLVSFRAGATVRKMLSLAAHGAGFTPRIGFATANMGPVRAFVSAGLGVALVPQSALEVPSPPLRA